MPAYQSTTGGTIGALLRQIEEDKQKSPLAELPSNQPGSPVRDLIQGPLQSVESPDTAHVMSVKPELSGAGDTAPSGVVPANVPLNQPGAPAAPAAPVVAPVIQRPIDNGPEVVAPQAPSAAPAAVSTPNPTPVPTPTPRANPVGLGTQVMPFSQPAVKGTSTSKPKTAAQQAPHPSPTPGAAPVPTPTMAMNAPRSNYGGQPIVDRGFNPLQFLASLLQPFNLSKPKTLASR